MGDSMGLNGGNPRETRMEEKMKGKTRTRNTRNRTNKRMNRAAVAAGVFATGANGDGEDNDGSGQGTSDEKRIKTPRSWTRERKVRRKKTLKPWDGHEILIRPKCCPAHCKTTQ